MQRLRVDMEKIIKDWKPRIALATTVDGRKWAMKSVQTREDPKSPVWLANELVYWCIARKVRDPLPLPDGAILDYDDSISFGTEVLEGREPVKQGDWAAIENDEQKYRRVLTRGLLLDMALLNTDRADHFLRNGVSELWPFDHEKTLWGNGRRSSDGWSRIDPAYPSDKVNDFLTDFSTGAHANSIVWQRDNRELTEGIQWLEQLLNNRDVFCCAWKEIPEEWLWERGLTNPHIRRMEQFLGRWWCDLGWILKTEECINTMQNLLNARAKQYYQKERERLQKTGRPDDRIDQRYWPERLLYREDCLAGTG